MNSAIEINACNYILNNKYSITFTFQKFIEIFRIFNFNLDHLIDKIQILDGKIVILEPSKDVF